MVGIAAALWSSGVGTGEGELFEFRQILDSFGSVFSSSTDSGADVGSALTSGMIMISMYAKMFSD